MADIGFSLLNAVSCKDPFILTADANPSVTSINQKIMMVRSFITGRDPTEVWFKFVVKNAADLPKELILRNILEAVQLKFVPIKFHAHNGDSIFYVKYCLEQIMSFIRQNFTVRIHSSKMALRLEIEVGTRDHVPEVNVNDLVALVVQRRVSSCLSTSLDLSSFHLEPDLEAYCFFPLSIVSNLQKVIKCADHFAITPYTSLDLSNNQIKHLSCFHEKLANFSNLRSLDLRNNQLLMSSLQAVGFLSLVDLKLDGNPLCDLYEKEFEYVKDVLHMFQSLRFLDGCALSTQGHYIVRPVFCNNPLAQDFLDQFLAQYYSIFDSDKRHLLFGFYHSEAVFSLTSTFLAGQSTSTNANLSEYLSESRNAKKISDCEKFDGLLYKGTRQIMDFIKKLPRTQHDDSSFAADVLIFNPTCVKISVTGLFREPDSEFASVRYFKRNFVLHYFNKVYLIINDMLYVTNCTSEQAVTAFRNKDSELPTQSLDLFLTTRAMHISLSNEQKVKMVEKISDITNMNQEWSRRCLEDVQYDLRNALVYFQKHYEEQSVPSEAFINP